MGSTGRDGHIKSAKGDTAYVRGKLASDGVTPGDVLGVTWDSTNDDVIAFYFIE